jgi:two-component system phosphate regulon sensor histidine kinase PhoR
VEVLAFLVGLAIGLAIWGWQKIRFDKRLTDLSRDLKPDAASIPSFTSISQLSLAIAYQQQIRDHLEQELDIYKQIFYLAPIGYLQVDDENRLLWCNPQARELLGITHAQIQQPRLLLEFVRSYDLDQLVEQTRCTGQPCQADWMFYPVNADPARITKQEAYPIRGFGFPLPHDYVGIFLENRQEAVILQQQRNRWASDVAHELKTPLTSIRLVAETLQSRLDPSLRGWLTRLINETIRLSNLVEDLLDLGQLDRHSSDCLDFADADLVELIHSAWMNLDPLARKKNLQLSYLGPEHLLLQLDRQRIYRVLINLLDNAIKYSPPWQNIVVKLTTLTDSDPELSQAVQQQQVILEVIDTGPGFQEEDLPLIFERFYRSEPSRSRYLLPDEQSHLTHLSYVKPNEALLASETASDEKKQSVETGASNFQQRSSSGLGLSIVRQIVEAHGGSVTAGNHPDTQGAWLRVKLPWRPPVTFRH